MGGLTQSFKVVDWSWRMLKAKAVTRETPGISNAAELTHI